MTAQPQAGTPQLLLEHHLKALHLPTVLREYDKLARQCAIEKADFPNYLLRLTELEQLDRDRRATERRIRQAKFPVVKSLDSFDFLAIPTLNKGARPANTMVDESGQPGIGYFAILAA
jgi:DNA replication protein DnaC